MVSHLVHLPLLNQEPLNEPDLISLPAFRFYDKRSSSQSHITHQQEQFSWDFLSNYVRNVQIRHDKMGSKITSAKVVLTRLEENAHSEKLAREELIRQKNLDDEKKAEQSNIYERPQAKALADSFISSTKEIFEMNRIFEKSEESSVKAFRMKLKLNINRRTGQITDSLKQIKTVVSELVHLCFESRTFSKNAFSFCLVLLAEKLLAQAESQVSLHAPSAFPLALVAVEISTNVVEFSSVLMSSLIQKCCFAVPRYPQKASNEAEFKIKLGYISVDGAIKESDSAFFERMCGLISFYAAIIQTNSLSGKPNVLGLSLGWTWLATILNLPPRTITSYLIVSFLEQASFAFNQRFGVNFEKLIQFLSEKYLPLIPSSSIASKTRLEIICKEILSSGHKGGIKEPVGRKIGP